MMSAVTDDLVGQLIKTGSNNEMGRWSYTRLLGKHGQHIIIILIYQVCNQQPANCTCLRQVQLATVQHLHNKCPFSEKVEKTIHQGNHFLMTLINKLKNGIGK
jgi:hypothetical protein